MNSKKEKSYKQGWKFYFVVHTKLNKTELQFLAGKRYILRALYIFGIRQYMDYKTGITGIKRRISWQSLREELYVDPQPGIKDSGNPTESKVRRAAEQLEKEGIIHKILHPHHLIFECVLATRDKSVQKKADIKPTLQADIKADSQNPMPYIGIFGKADINTDILKSPFLEKADTHPVSDINTEEKRWADTELDNKCPTAGEWQQFLIERGFAMHYVLGKPKVMQMLKGWEAEKLTIANARTAFDCAENNLQGLPASPMYYAGFVKEVLLTERQPANTKWSNQHANRKQPVKTHSTRRVLETCLAVSQYRKQGN